MNDSSHSHVQSLSILSNEQVCSFRPSQSNFATLHILDALSKDMMKMMFWEAYLGESTKRISVHEPRVGVRYQRPALRVLVEVLSRYAIVDSLARFFGSSYSFFRSPI